MANPNKKPSFLFRFLGLIGSGILWVLSIPAVRNWIWKKLLRQGDKMTTKLRKDPNAKDIIDVKGEVIK